MKKMKRRKRLSSIGFSSIETNEDWVGAPRLGDVFYALGMLDKYFFWKMSPVLNDSYAQVNVLLTNMEVIDSSISTSPLTKSLGLVEYSIDLSEVNRIADDENLYGFVYGLYCSISKAIFKSLKIEINEEEMNSLLIKMKTILDSDPTFIVKPLESFN
jgi:hypothetical protein